MKEDLRYELVEGWQQLPKGFAIGDVSAVGVDSRDRVYLITRHVSRVVVFERDGTFVASWGEGIFSNHAHGISIGPDDSVYCSDDLDHTVRKFTPGGELLMTLGTRGVRSDTGYDTTRKTSYEKMMSITHGGLPFNRPTAATVGPSGEIYAADGYGNSRVHRFSAKGKLLQSWGEPGAGPGQFYLPHCVCVAADGRVLVADRQNDRIQVFSPDGKFLNQWTDLRRPAAIAIDPSGLVYVSELGWSVHQSFRLPGHVELPPRVSVRNSDGKVLACLGRDDGYAPASFFSPHGIGVDSHGDFYVGELPVTNSIGHTDVSGVPNPPGRHALQKFVRQ